MINTPFFCLFFLTLPKIMTNLSTPCCLLQLEKKTKKTQKTRRGQWALRLVIVLCNPRKKALMLVFLGFQETTTSLPSRSSSFFLVFFFTCKRRQQAEKLVVVFYFFSSLAEDGNKLGSQFVVILDFFLQSPKTTTSLLVRRCLFVFFSSIIEDDNELGSWLVVIFCIF
jgi:hypothetical protein